MTNVKSFVILFEVEKTMPTHKILTVIESQITETPKAYGLKNNGKTVVWIPKSQVSKYPNKNGTIDLIIPHWLYAKNTVLVNFVKKEVVV